MRSVAAIDWSVRGDEEPPGLRFYFFAAVLWRRCLNVVFRLWHLMRDDWAHFD
jgi:hypothetical protein